MSASCIDAVIVPRPDRPTFFTVRQNKVVEIDGLGKGERDQPEVLGAFQSSDNVVTMAVSTNTTGETYLGLILQSGFFELWDLENGSILLDVIKLPASNKKESVLPVGKGACLLTASTGISTNVFYYSTNGPSSSISPPTVHIIKGSPSLAVTGSQKLSQLDRSRRNKQIAEILCHPWRPLLFVAFVDGIIHLYDSSRLQSSGQGEEVFDAAENSVVEEEEDGERSEEGSQTEGTEARAGTKVSSKSQKNLDHLLLRPLLAFNAQVSSGLLSCMAISAAASSHGEVLLAAGSRAGQVVLWSLHPKLLLVHGRHVAPALTSLKPLNALSPLSSMLPLGGNIEICSLDFVRGGPFLAARTRDPTNHTTQVMLLAVLPKTLSLSFLSNRLPSPRGLAFQGLSCAWLLLESDQSRVSKLLTLECLPLPTSLLATESSPNLPWQDVLLRKTPLDGLAPSPFVSFYVQSSLCLSWKESSRGGSPSLFYRSLVGVERFVMGLQKRMDNLRDKSHSKFRLPSSTAEVKAALSKEGVRTDPSLSLWIGNIEGLEVLFWPTRLVKSPDARTVLVFFQVFSSTAQSKLEAFQKKDPVSGFFFENVSSVDDSFYLLITYAPRSEGRESKSLFKIEKVGLATKGEFCSNDALILLRADRREMAVLSRSAESGEWIGVKEEIRTNHDVKNMYSVPLRNAADVALLYSLSSCPREEESAMTMSTQQHKQQEILTLFQGASLEALGSISANLSKPSFILDENEVLEEVLWQIHEEESVGIQRRLLALLTSQRLMILSEDLIVLASMDRRAAKVKKGTLLWLGLALLFVSSEGYLSYVCVGERRSFSEVRPLCCLAEDHVAAGVRPILVLPDRLTYASRRAFNGWHVEYLHRPLLALETSVVGISSLSKLMLAPAGSCPRKAVNDLLERVVCSYVRSYSDSGNDHRGPGKNAGATELTCTVLCQLGLFDLAAMVAGMNLDEEETALLRGSSNDAFRRAPWIPVEMKAGIAVGMRHWRQALIELLAKDPSAQDYILNPGSTRNIALPHRFLWINKVLTVLAHDAMLCGQAGTTLQIFDVAGEDQSLILLLLRYSLDSGLDQSFSDLLKSIFSAAYHPALQGYLKGIFHNQESQPDVSHLPIANRSFPFVHQRRSTLLAGVGSEEELYNWPQAQRKTVTTKIMTAEQQQQQQTACQNHLVLERLEDWLGRASPELMEEAQKEDDQESDWVVGIGQGREDEDNVVAYWRFGELEVFGPSEKNGLHCLSGDLSTFGHLLESVVDNPGIRFEESTCPLDQGDDSRVRKSMDIVWNELEGDDDIPCAGLEVRIIRGSALDIGPYHPGPTSSRSKVTVECWIQRPSCAAPCKGREVYISRFIDDEQEEKEAELWSFGALADGALAFWVGKAEGAQQVVQTPAGRLAASQWTHVAFALEIKSSSGTQAQVTLYVGGREEARGPIKFRPMPSSRLALTRLKIGQGLHGHRMTELRIWAMARTAVDIYDNRETYLRLAERRKRLAFKIRASTPLPSKGDSESKDMGTGGLPSLAIGGRAASAQGEKGAVASRRRRYEATSSTPSPIPFAPASPFLQPPLAVKNRSLRRMSPSTGLTSPSDVVGQETVKPIPVVAPQLAAGSLGTQSHINDVPSKEIFVQKQGKNALLYKHITLPVANEGCQMSCILQDSRASTFAFGGRHLCLRELDETTNTTSILVFTLSTSEELVVTRSRYRFQAESSILMGESGRPALIACYTLRSNVPSTSEADGTRQQGLLEVYDLEKRKGIARQLVTTAVAFWRWVSDRDLILVTDRAVFRWNVLSDEGTPTQPRKLFERQDNKHSASYRVVNYRQSDSGRWGLLTSVHEAKSTMVYLFSFERHQCYVEHESGLVGLDVGRNKEGRLVLIKVLRSSKAEGAALSLKIHCLENEDALSDENHYESMQALSSHMTEIAELSLPSLVEASSPADRVWVFFFPRVRKRAVAAIVFARSLVIYNSDRTLVSHEFEESFNVLDASLSHTDDDILILRGDDFQVFKFEIP